MLDVLLDEVESCKDRGGLAVRSGGNNDYGIAVMVGIEAKLSAGMVLRRIVNSGCAVLGGSMEPSLPHEQVVERLAEKLKPTPPGRN